MRSTDSSGCVLAQPRPCFGSKKSHYSCPCNREAAIFEQKRFQLCAFLLHFEFAAIGGFGLCLRPTPALGTLFAVDLRQHAHSAVGYSFNTNDLCRIFTPYYYQRYATIAKPNTADNMEIKRSGSQPSSKGPTDWFTGTVRIDPLFQVNAPARAAGASVTFEPGARTAWHRHPLGQTLIVTSGCGWVQREGGPIEEIHPGDVVWFPPGEKHWHGATPTTAMTHTAIQEQLDGKVVEWLEKVSDDQYRR